MDATCTIQDSIHVFRLVHKYVSRILGTYHTLGALNFLKKVLALYLHLCYINLRCSKHDKYGLLVKRLRRRPLKAESRVRFPYRLLISLRNQ